MTWYQYLISGIGVYAGLVILFISWLDFCAGIDEEWAEWEQAEHEQEQWARKQTRPQQSPGAVIRK